MDEERERDPVEARQERRLRLLEGERVGELRALTKDQVIEKHDAHIDEARRSNKHGVRLVWLRRAQVYADELSRRENVRQGETMEKLTRSLNRLTWVITAATIIGVVLTALSLLS